MVEGPPFERTPTDDHPGNGDASTGDELLDPRPDRRQRRWPTALVAVALVVAGIVALVQSRSSTRPDARPSPTVSVAPVIPDFATSTPGRVGPTPLRTPGQCPVEIGCTAGTTSPAVLAAVRAAIARALGRVTVVGISEQLRPGTDGRPGSLFSRTIVATVRAGTLRLLVSSSGADSSADLLLPSARDAVFANAFVDGYYVHAALSGASNGSASVAQYVVLGRLIQDERLLRQ